MFAFDDRIDRNDGGFQCSNRASKVALRGCRYPNIATVAKRENHFNAPPFLDAFSFLQARRQQHQLSNFPTEQDHLNERLRNGGRGKISDYPGRS
jgi:hypothetical protein